MKNIIVIPFNIPRDWSMDYLDQAAFELASKGLRKVKMFFWERCANQPWMFISSFMKSFNKLRNRLVVIPFSLPWDWSADYERQTAMTLAKKGYKVIVYLHRDSHFLLKGNQKKYPKIDNIYFYTPVYLIPLKRFQFIEKINQFINLNYLVWKYSKVKKIILWIFDPKFYTFPKILKRKVISLYDCVDYHESSNLRYDIKIKKMEKELIKNSDYFFVNSKTLMYLHKKDKEKVYLLPQGFSIQDFRNPKKTNVKFPNNKPLVGFVGSLDYRLDFDLLFQIIQNRQDCNFVFWGPINTDYEEMYYDISKKIKKMLSFRNVIYGKSKKRSEIPNIIKQFDICIIPYDIKQKVNKYCYPMKFFEYIYLSKLVISTPIRELKYHKNFVKIASSVDGWEKNISFFLRNNKQSTVRENLQINFCKENSWLSKIDKILNILGI